MNTSLFCLPVRIYWEDTDGGGVVGTDPTGTDEGDADGWGEWHDDSFVMRAAGGFCVAF